MRNVSVRINDSLIKKLDKIAKNEDRDRSYIINKALEGYVLEEERILLAINEGLSDIQEGRVQSFDEVKREMEEYMKDDK